MAEIKRNSLIEDGRNPDKIKYWEVQNIPSFIVEELRRRKNSQNIGLEYTDFNSNPGNYKGPMTPWIRVFSNGTGLPKNLRVPQSDFLKKGGKIEPYEGFILEGGHGFNKAFGLSSDISKGNLSVFGESSKAIIGYQSNNEPHYIDNKYRNFDNFSTSVDEDYPQNNASPILLPPPGVVSADIRTTGEQMTYADIKFKCYSIAQLEYLAPFFLTPGVNLFVEFGWNLFNEKSLLNLDNTNELFEIYKSPVKAIERFMDSNGNYGLAMGPVTDYNFNTKDGIEYDCTVKITDRQALFQGFRIDVDSVNNKTKESKDENLLKFYQKNKINFKNLLRTYLPFLDECIVKKENFQRFIQRIKDISTEDNRNVKTQVRSTNGFIGTRFDVENANLKKIGYQENDSKLYYKLDSKSKETSFFSNKKESRVFFGRNESFFSGKDFSFDENNKEKCLEYRSINLKVKKINSVELEKETVVATTTPNISAGRLTEGLNLGDGIQQVKTLEIAKSSKDAIEDIKTDLYSDIDKNHDFDRSNDSNEIWMQLDFLFELLNENIPSSFFNINYDILVNAHPNLISCDKNVLIPNPIAPKIHRGTLSELNGYLNTEEKEKSNKFFTQPWVDIFNLSESDSDSLYKSFDTCRNIFKTGRSNGSDTPKDKRSIFGTKRILNPEKYDYSYGLGVGISESTFERQDLDKILNYYSYLKANGDNDGEYAFPQKKDYIDEESGIEYKKYRYGNLKHLYISRSKVIDIASDEKITNIQQFVQEVLNVINKSVNNYWLFDIVNDANGGLTIIDKSLNNLKEIYTFEISSGDNVVKEINFDVSLSPENSTQIIFGSGNNIVSKEKKLEILKGLIDQNETQNQYDVDDLLLASKSLPSISFSDRFDYQDKILKERYDRISGSITNDPKSKDLNPEITSLQTYGSSNNGVLQMTFAVDTEEAGKSNIYYNLNLPPTMKSKITEILNDSDYENNTVMYSNVADNFIVDIKLEGIFGFRMFQHFAINNLPKPYVQGNCIFMVKEISHVISDGSWVTNVTALLKGIHKKNISKYYLI